MFLHTFHQISFWISDVVKSYTKNIKAGVEFTSIIPNAFARGTILHVNLIGAMLLTKLIGSIFVISLVILISELNSSSNMRSIFVI